MNAQQRANKRAEAEAAAQRRKRFRDARNFVPFNNDRIPDQKLTVAQAKDR